MAFNSDPALQINQLPISVEFPSDQKQFNEIVNLLYKRIANCVNSKEGGLFSLQETGNSQQYFTLNNPQTFRNVYRTVFDVVDENGGNIAAGATVSFAHNITGIVAATHIYGSATNVAGDFLPVPYVSATLITDQIEVYMTSTNVVVVNGTTQGALTQFYLVCEYVKT